MATLENRIEALETTSTAGLAPITNIVRFIKPGHLDAELHTLHTKEGQSWQRLQSETQQELIDRATGEAARTAWGAAVLFEGEPPSPLSTQPTTKE